MWQGGVGSADNMLGCLPREGFRTTRCPRVFDHWYQRAHTGRPQPPCSSRVAWAHNSLVTHGLRTS